MNMTISKRLLIMIVASVAALLIVGVTGLLTASNLSRTISVANNDAIPSILNIEKAKADVLRIQLGVTRHILNTDDAQMAGIEESIKDARAGFNTRLDKYAKDLVSNEEDRAITKIVQAAAIAYEETVDKVLDTSRQNNDVEAAQMQAEILQPRGDALHKALNDLSVYNEKNAQTEADAAASYSSTARNFSIIIILFALIVIVGMGVTLLRGISGALERVQRTVGQIQRNRDFTLRVPVDRRDELGVMAEDLNQLLQSLQDNLKTIADSANAVATASGRMAASSDQVAAASQAQSQATTSMAAAVEEMTVSITHVGDRASDANNLSKESGRLAVSGDKVVSQTVEDINQIAHAVNLASQRIRELGEQTDKISGVVGVIREVAEQTNLLALNAAIEAARAGEQGRGFAVVADEVRKLAERTSNSTSEISAMIETVGGGARSAIAEMENAVTSVGTGVARAQDTSTAIRQIGSSSQRTVDMVSEIADAIREQSVASTSISQQIENIAQMTEKASAAATDSANSARELDRLGESMKRIVAEYRL